MRAAWISDIHLNFLTSAGRDRFGAQLRESGADVIILTGDISEAPTLLDHLRGLQEDSAMAVLFVVGNHDYYRSSIAYMTEKLNRVCADPALKLTYLSNTGVVTLTDKTALVGHDGWYDGESGDYWSTRLVLNDFEVIGEFRGAMVSELGTLPSLNEFRFNPGLKHIWKPIMERLALASAKHVDTNLRAAIAMGHKRIVVATHVPPFPGASWHQGKTSNAEWLPFFSNITLGNAIVEVMNDHPDVECLVLTGHSHGRGSYSPIPNVTVLTAGAEYGSQEIQRPLLEIE